MEHDSESTSAANNEPVKTGWWRDLALLAVLLTVAVGLRGWLLWNTEVAARDSIGFIRYALQFEGVARPPFTKTWADVIRNNHQHPGYPLTILAVSLPVRYFLGGISPYAMQLSAQLASGLAAILLVLPMYFLGKTLFDRGIGFWGALLFQCLPVSGHILSDGLSEALFLLLCTTALLSAAHAVRTGSWQRFILCGAFCGLTYLVRPEGGLVLMATGMVWIAMQLTPRWRRRWDMFSACGAGLTVAAAVVGSPYVLITGHLTNKPSAQIMVGTYPEEAIKANRRGCLDREASPRVANAPGSPASAAGSPTLCRPLFASILAVSLKPDGSLALRLPQGLLALAEEFVRGFHYIGWLPALLGVCWYAGRARAVPGIWIVLVLCGLHVLVLWRLAVVVGYVSERHVQILVLAVCYPVVGVLRDLPRWLAAGWSATHSPRSGLLRRAASAFSLLLLLGLVAAGMPKTLQKLHANRAGYHAAGQWLARQVVHHVDKIEDGHCWAHFYAGEVFDEWQPESMTPGTRYIVVGRHKDPESGSGPPEAAPTGQIVYHWPPERTVEKADVVIYAAPIPRPALTNPSKS